VLKKLQQVARGLADCPSVWFVIKVHQQLQYMQVLQDFKSLCVYLYHPGLGIGVARVCSGCTCTPRAEKNFFSGLIYRKKCVSAPPQNRSAPPSQSKSQFLGVFARWLRFGGIFRRRRLKKGRQLFLAKKEVHPRRQNPGYAYGFMLVNTHIPTHLPI